MSARELPGARCARRLEALEQGHHADPARALQVLHRRDCCGATPHADPKCCLLCGVQGQLQTAHVPRDVSCSSLHKYS